MSPAARRATGLVLLGVVVAVACTFLGRWQWNRHVWRDAAIAVVETNWSADPVPLDTVLPATDTPLTDDDVWRRVTVVGHYEPDATVLLRNRPVDGAPAYHVLVPFVVEDASAGTSSAPTQAGTVLVVDRGWVDPGADASADVAAPAPPEGSVTLTARLRHDEPASSRTAPPRPGPGHLGRAGPRRGRRRGRVLRRLRRHDRRGPVGLPRPRAAAAPQHRPRVAPVLRLPVVDVRARRADRLQPGRAARAPGRAPRSGRPRDPILSPLPSRSPRRAWSCGRRATPRVPAGRRSPLPTRPAAGVGGRGRRGRAHRRAARRDVGARGPRALTPGPRACVAGQARAMRSRYAGLHRSSSPSGSSSTRSGSSAATAPSSCDTRTTAPA